MTAFTPPPEWIEAAFDAMKNAVIRDDEGEFPRLFDLLDCSGENKARTITYGLARAAIAVIARELGEEAAKKIEYRFGKPRGERGLEGGYQAGLYDAAEDIAAALRAHFGVPSAPTPREKVK